MSLDSRIANLGRVITESIRLHSNLTHNDICSLQDQVSHANAQLLARLNCIEDTLTRLEAMLTAMQKGSEKRERKSN